MTRVQRTSRHRSTRAATNRRVAVPTGGMRMGQRLIPRNAAAWQQTVGNRVTRQMIGQQAVSQRQEDPPKALGYLGMNPGAHQEGRALKWQASEKTILSLNNAAAEKGLQTRQQQISFIHNTLGIRFVDKDNPDRDGNMNTNPRFFTVLDCLEKADANFREQMADLMVMFNGAERGEYLLERLVLSGHSNGLSLWGDKSDSHTPGIFTLNSDLLRLVRAFPDAAAQIKDLMFSACYSAAAIDFCIEAFPNLQTCWSYAGSSPSIGFGSVRHIQQWEQKTREDKSFSKGDKRGESAIWTRKDGFIVGDPSESGVEQLMSTFITQQEHFNKIKDGDEPMNQGFLTRYYQHCQAFIRHPEIDETPRVYATEVMEKVLRLRFWSGVLKNFKQENGRQMAAAHKTLGIRAPRNFTRMTRRELKAYLARYQAALTAETPAQPRIFYHERLQQGLWELDSDIIREDWAH